jgi:peptidoglycan/LPS O-acetylase OafA/YrhL
MLAIRVAAADTWWIFKTGSFGPTEWKWLAEGGLSCVPVGLFIAVMSFRKGWISQSLSHPFPVLLGEISYSIYLLHTLILAAYRPYMA